jgi:hypothetical protein
MLANYITAAAGDVVQRGSVLYVRNVISHFAYANSRHPALSAKEQSAYDWIIEDW